MSLVLETLAEAERTGQYLALATVIRVQGSVPRHEGAKMLVYPDGRTVGTIGGGEMESRVCAEALAALSDGRARIVSYSLSDPGQGDPGVCGGTAEVFVEPIRPPATVLIVGAGHVGRAVAQLARFLEYRIVVSDDRPEMCTPDSFPGADLYLACPMAELPRRTTIDKQTFLVLATRGAAVDIEGLPALLAVPFAYLGVIGSRRRWLTTCKELQALGVSADSLQRVHSPIGLELSAETPEEIAVSIMAEIILTRRGGSEKPMRSVVPGSGGSPER